MNARRAEKNGEHGEAAMHRACLSPAEWEEAGWKKRNSRWVHVRDGKTVAEITHHKTRPAKPGYIKPRNPLDTDAHIRDEERRAWSNCDHVNNEPEYSSGT